MSPTINLGNYSNEKIGFTADINEDDELKQAVEVLRQKVRDCALPNIEDVQSEIYKAQMRVANILKQLGWTQKRKRVDGKPERVWVQ